LDEGEVVGRELIVAGCHTPVLLDLVEELGSIGLMAAHSWSVSS
jgi:hypothetical protein